VKTRRLAPLLGIETVGSTSSSQPAVLLVAVDPYIIRACVRAGMHCVVVHGPGVTESGYVQVPPDVETVFVEDRTNVGTVLSALARAGMVGRRFTCVLTSDEDSLVVAAALGVILGVPAMSPDVAVLFRDKRLQKQVVSRAGVPVARSRVIEDVHRLDPSVFDGFAKAVLKPIAGAGTHRTSVIRSREDLVAAGAAMRRDGVPARTFLLEEFVDGAEWVVNGVVVDGAVEFFGLGVYPEPRLTTVSTQAAVQMEALDPTTDAAAYDRVRPTVHAALDALGLRSGVFHMELFVPAGGRPPVFGECAARRGGGMTQEVVERKFDVDLGAAAVACAVGTDPGIRVSVAPDTVGWTSLVNRAGVLVRCPTVEQLEALPGVECAQVELPYGAQIGESLAGSWQRIGQVLVTGGTPEEFRARRDEVVRWFDERLVVVPPGASPAELRAWQATHWPDTDARFEAYRPHDVLATSR
jgi:biotin carboxylase